MGSICAMPIIVMKVMGTVLVHSLSKYDLLSVGNLPNIPNFTSDW